MATVQLISKYSYTSTERERLDECNLIPRPEREREEKGHWPGNEARMCVTPPMMESCMVALSGTLYVHT